MASLSNILGGGSKSIKLPLLDNFDNYNIDIFLPKIESSGSDFSSTGNFTQRLGTHFYKDFTINASHQMTVNGPTIIYCSGTFTVGGNGIVSLNNTGSENNLTEPLSSSSSTWQGGLDMLVSSGGTGGTVGGSGIPGSDGADGTNNAGGGGGGGFEFGAGGNGASRKNQGTVGGTSSSKGGGGGGGSGYFGGRLGADNNGGAVGATGTTSRGFLVVCANTISVAGNINFAGGDGGNATNPTTGGGSGGGGGGNGGFVYMFANSFTHSSGTIDVSGGDGGTGSNGSSQYGGGGGGSGGDCGLFLAWATDLTTSGGTRTGAAGTGASGGTGGTNAGDAGDGGDGVIPYGLTSGIRLITGDPF